MNKLQADLKEQVSQNSALCTRVETTKLNKDIFDKITTDVKESLKTVKLALKDNFSQLLATDNYIEKYLPFKIQSMISDNLLSFLDAERQKRDSEEFKNIF